LFLVVLISLSLPLPPYHEVGLGRPSQDVLPLVTRQQRAHFRTGSGPADGSSRISGVHCTGPDCVNPANTNAYYGAYRRGGPRAGRP
jgi:hypothetical protein